MSKGIRDPLSLRTAICIAEGFFIAAIALLIGVVCAYWSVTRACDDMGQFTILEQTYDCLVRIEHVDHPLTRGGHPHE